MMLDDLKAYNSLSETFYFFILAISSIVEILIDKF